MNSAALIVGDDNYSYFDKGWKRQLINRATGLYSLVYFHEDVREVGYQNFPSVYLSDYPYWGKQLERLRDVFMTNPPRRLWWYFSDTRVTMQTSRLSFFLSLFAIPSILLLVGILVVSILRYEIEREGTKV